MATRPIYQADTKSPFYRTRNIDFQYYSGFSVAQKQRTINSLHEAYHLAYPHSDVLEISSKSPLAIGVSLSAFNLQINRNDRSFSVECAFQSSKVFENGGPYTDLLDKTSKEAKKDSRLHESGKLIAFRYFDTEFPLEPKEYFYNWLYIHALNQNQELAQQIIRFDSFTDIEFNPQKSVNCQAKAAAIFVGLHKQNLLNNAVSSHQDFLKIVYGLKTGEMI